MTQKKITDQNDLLTDPSAQNRLPEMIDEEISDGGSVLGHAPGDFDDAEVADLDELRKGQGESVDTDMGPTELNTEKDQNADIQKDWQS